MRMLAFLVRLAAYIVLGYFIYQETGWATLLFYCSLLCHLEIKAITLPPFHDKEMAAILSTLDVDSSEYKQ